jgi:hypothetical protein
LKIPAKFSLGVSFGFFRKPIKEKPENQSQKERRIEASSYARPKSDSQPSQRTNRANRRSSSADRFVSRFSALSTAVALHFGVYSFVRKHHTLKTTPAVAAGIEEKPWDLERAVEMTADYMRRKEDAEFEKHSRQQGYKS